MQAMLEDFKQSIAAKIQPLTDAGSAHDLQRISQLGSLRCDGLVQLSRKQLQSLPTSIEKNMPGLPVVPLEQTAAFTELRNSGLVLKDSGSLRHELPVLLSALAVDSMLEDVVTTVDANRDALTLEMCIDILSPNGPLRQLLNWSAGLHAARYESIAAFCEDPRVSEAYVLGRFSQMRLLGSDPLRDEIRKTQMEAKIKAANKQIGSGSGGAGGAAAGGGGGGAGAVGDVKSKSQRKRERKADNARKNTEVAANRAAAQV
jgi:hypothetical protein